MNAPLGSGKFPLDSCSIVLAVTLAILMSIAPHEASAKGGTFRLFSTAEAATVTSSRKEATPETFGSCGGKRYRDPNTHRCRGPADFGH
jgi:hypothetical protein